MDAPQVVNQHGVDMFADKYDNAHAVGPHGASDGSLPPGTNLTLRVNHPDYAWRCHEDRGWAGNYGSSNSIKTI